MPRGYAARYPQNLRRPDPPYNQRRLRRCCLERHDRFHVVRQLPTGGQGQAEVLQRESTKELIVCKTVPHKKVYYYHDKQDDVPEEVRILRDLLKGPDFLMTFLDYSVGLEDINFYYQYYHGGDLWCLVENFKDQNVKVPELLMWQCFRQMSEAVAFLHWGPKARVKGSKAYWQPVVHRDIKPENILLRNPVVPNSKSHPLFVLADFGLATTDLGQQDFCGTSEYQPPEGSPATQAADVWALGAVIHCMGHENKPPIAPMPSSFSYGMAHWARLAHAKLPRSFGQKYSLTLELHMFRTFEPDPDKRIASLRLLSEVEREFRPAGQAGQLKRREGISDVTYVV